MTEAFGNLATDQAGYRLHRLEVYNWGTFDGSVYSVAPAGNTALLTGKNGSGKSTLVDALLTLLVPTRGTGGRNYNQAAGNQARERTEVSYVRGAYGQLHNDERGTTETRYLRTEKTYSVLLATFENPVLERTVTAGMVFWFSNGSLTKFYVLAQRPLSVSEHFRAESDIGRTLKKDLRDMDGVKVFDQFNRYSAALNRRLGLGEKAVDLFNQIVAIKDISGLNDFVRRHMLNEYDSRAAIDDLRQQYNDLTTAFNAIERAEQQRDQLQPLLNDVQRHTDQQERIAETTYKIDALPLYKATIQRRYLKSRITKLQAKQSELETERTALEQRITQLDAKRTDIQSTLASNDINRRLQDLQAQAKRHEDTLRDRQKTAQKYQQAVRAAELDDTLSADAFAQNQQQAAEQLQRIEDEKQRLNDERIALGVQLEKLKEQGQEVEAEIESLRGRKSQLDRTSLNIREGLAQALDLPEDTFPYVGELLRVKEDEAQWEPAIQRVLNGLGRQLLVPNVYYDPVSEYVEQNDLKGRLVYQRVKGAPSVSESHLPDNALYFKLQIKPGTDFRDWLAAHLIERYDYVCSDSLADFRHARRAITMQGQIKHGPDRHEKDDRSRLGDRRRYVLGWENEAMIAAYEQQRDELLAKFHEIGRLDDEIKGAIARLDQREKALNQVAFYSEFADVDVSGAQTSLQQARDDYERLQATPEAARFQQLNDDLAATKTQLDEARARQRQQDQQLGQVQGDLRGYKRQFEEAQRVSAEYDEEAMQPVLQAIDDDRQRDENLPEFSLDTIERILRLMGHGYERYREGQQGRLREMASSAIRRMQQFKNDYHVETQDVDASMEPLTVQWYTDKLEQIERHDLPRYKADFEKLMQRNVVSSINGFQAALNNQVDQYQRQIDQLNGSLRNIDYTTETYIQLVYERTGDASVQQFRTDLANCFPNVGRDGDIANRRAYENIRDLLQALEERRTWADKVTDVRQWLDFAAEERLKADDTPRERYEGASGKSGGQKAKLAYTILASAIAYQYGLFAPDRDPRKTFRFVVVDEVFSKSDESNSRFAMDLFRSLGLQVLVVTPSDKLHIVEPYIGACHYVWNNEDGNHSQVQNLTVEQLAERRAELAAGAD